MKRNIRISVSLWGLFLCLAFSQASVAQVPANEGHKSIFEALASPIMGQGVIRIFQSPVIAAQISSPSLALSGARVEGNFAVLEGYRIQVYSGNNPRSKGIATQRAEQLRAAFPDLEASVEYEAPFWRVRVGAFLDTAEAREYLQELQREFPAFSKEMYIVRTTIKIPR